jgi:hypothetical protein
MHFLIEGKKNLSIVVILILALSLPVSLEAAITPKIGGKCIKKNQTVLVAKTKLICLVVKKSLIWQKYSQTPSKTPVVPTASPTPTPIPTVTPGKAENPVVKKINIMLGSLSLPSKTTPPEVIWLTSPDLNQTRLESLKFQHQRISDSFPSLYFWDKPALAIVSPDIAWIKVKMEEAGCQGGVMDMVRRLEAEKNLVGAGTSVCRGVLTAYFLDRGFTDVLWSNVLGSEFGGAIQENSYKKSPAYKSGDPNWYSNATNWYAEGSQTILSVIASARVSRSWSHQGRNLARISPYCSDDTLTVNKCGSYFIGEAAVELLIALYGWDSVTRWFENIDLTKKQEITFEETFKDPLEKFQGWADTYYRYIVKGEPLPASLLTRLGG